MTICVPKALKPANLNLKLVCIKFGKDKIWLHHLQMSTILPFLGAVGKPKLFVDASYARKMSGGYHNFDRTIIKE